MPASAPVVESRVAVASLAMAACVALGACATPPLMPYSTDTPPLVLAPASEAGVRDQRARFREIYCAVLDAGGRGLPDYRPCEDALTQVSPGPSMRSNRGPLLIPTITMRRAWMLDGFIC